MSRTLRSVIANSDGRLTLRVSSSPVMDPSGIAALMFLKLLVTVTLEVTVD